jgi:hypothetical protein
MALPWLLTFTKFEEDNLTAQWNFRQELSLAVA